MITDVKEMIKKAKKEWKVKVDPTYEVENKIYFLIGIGYEGFGLDGLDPKKVEQVKVGQDKEGKDIYATYYFGTDY